MGAPIAVYNPRTGGTGNRQRDPGGTVVEVLDECSRRREGAGGPIIAQTADVGHIPDRHVARQVVVRAPAGVLDRIDCGTVVL